MSYESSCALTLVILLICVMAWIRAYNVSKAKPERFEDADGNPIQIWKVADTVVNNLHHQAPADCELNNGLSHSQRH